MCNVTVIHILHLSPYHYTASFETWSETPPTIWDPLLFIWQSRVGLLYFNYNPISNYSQKYTKVLDQKTRQLTQRRFTLITSRFSKFMHICTRYPHFPRISQLLPSTYPPFLHKQIIQKFL